MFDIGFWELVLIAILALLVIGPEKLPKAAHDVGRVVAKIRSFIQTTKQELEKEFKIDETDSLKQDIEQLDHLMKKAPDRFNVKKGSSDDSS